MKKKTFLKIFAVIILFFAMGCEKEEPEVLPDDSSLKSSLANPAPPTVTISGLTYLNPPYVVTLNGTVNPNGLPTTVSFQITYPWNNGWMNFPIKTLPPFHDVKTVSMNYFVGTQGSFYYRIKAVNALGTVYSTQNYVKIPKRRKA